MVVSETSAGHIVAGRYQLIAEIGRGGMGRVWEARDTKLDRIVALKEVMLPAVPAAQHEVRLRQAGREARNAAALADHPHIVTIHDVVTENDVPWIVMQLVKGRSLSSVLHDPDDAPLPKKKVKEIAAAMLAALDAIHRAGIVHRDIKPHNILLADDGGILLTDFGIAKSDSDMTMTIAGSVVGTLAYIAPERAEGEPGTPASDYFSLGVTLFEAVEGYSPFAKDTSTGTLTALLAKPLPPMERAGKLAPLIKALTRKDPAERPDHAQAVALLTGADAGSGGTTQAKTKPLAAAATETSDALKPSPVVPAAPKPQKAAVKATTPAPGKTSDHAVLGFVKGLMTVVVLAGIAGTGFYLWHQAQQKTLQRNKQACTQVRAAEARMKSAEPSDPKSLDADQRNTLAQAWDQYYTDLQLAEAHASDKALQSQIKGFLISVNGQSVSLRNDDLDNYYNYRWEAENDPATAAFGGPCGIGGKYVDN